MYGMGNMAKVLTTVVEKLGIAEGAVYGGMGMGGHVVLSALPELPAPGGVLLMGTPLIGSPEHFHTVG